MAEAEEDKIIDLESKEYLMMLRNFLIRENYSIKQQGYVPTIELLIERIDSLLNHEIS